MKQIEILVVQVEEAVAFCDRGDIPSLRLALLLLDSAAELLMVRALGWPLYTDGVARKQLAGIQRLPPESQEKLADMAARLSEDVLSKAKLNKINREFDAKAKFLADKGLIREQYVPILGALHQYRNAAYHRDSFCADSLELSVLVYQYAVCDLLATLTPDHCVLEHADKVPRLQKYLAGNSGMGCQQAAGKALLSHTVERMPQGVAATLSTLLLLRLDVVSEALSYCARSYELSEEDLIVRMRAAPPDTERRFPYDTTSESVGEWRKAALAVAQAEGALEAFARYSAIESKFEPFEHQLRVLDRIIDDLIQHQIDVARGK